MSKLQEWFKEASKECKVFTSEEEAFLIYKGFRISVSEEGYLIQDTRKSNMYSPVTYRDMQSLDARGFIAGCDFVSMRKSQRRLKAIDKALVKLYTRRKKFRLLLTINKKLNEKRIRNINRRIQNLVDEMFFNKAKINQFNIKYNKNE